MLNRSVAATRIRNCHRFPATTRIRNFYRFPASLGLAALLFVGGPFAGPANASTPVAEAPSEVEAPEMHPGSEDDVAVRGRIVERLAASRALAGADVWVRVTDRKATLTGLVQDETTELRAIAIARRTPGVLAVVNELRTDPTRAERRFISIRDENLVENVARTLVAELFPDARPENDWAFGWEVDGLWWEFAVEADMGDVTLLGTVPSKDHITRVVEITRKIPGVRSVRARLGFTARSLRVAAPSRHD